MYFSAMYIGCVDIARRSARGRQTTIQWQKQVFIHTRLSRAYLALARLSCFNYLAGVNSSQSLWVSSVPKCKAPLAASLDILQGAQQSTLGYVGYRQRLLCWRRNLDKPLLDMSDHCSWVC